jgi:acyl-coenzyme A thioesterase PaaI-like protein
MTVDFIDAARFGDLVEGKGEVTRITRNLVFVRCTVWSGRRTLLNASGVFSFVRARGKGEESS